jgi:hypothetical protein
MPAFDGVVAGAFTFFSDALSWTAAEAHCVSLGGHLASIHSPSENTAVHDLCMPHACWIGFNDKDQETAWVWSDGSTADFRSFPGGVAPWNPGEPNGQGDEQTDGAYIYPTGNVRHSRPTKLTSRHFP